MQNRILVRLTLAVMAVTIIIGISRSATAVEHQQTPRSYLPLISNAPMAVAWDLAGNAGTNPLLHFLGTTDNKPLIIQPVAGNVGIGTTNPAQKLAVQTATGRSGVAHTDGNVILSTSIFTDTGRFGTLTNHPLTLFTNRSETGLRLNTDGRVGIGTNAPTNKLTVDLGSGPSANNEGITVVGRSTVGEVGVRLKNTGTNGREWFIASTGDGSGYGSGKLAFTEPGASPVLTIAGASRSVGINTTSPSGKLTIATAANGEAGLLHTAGGINLSTGIGSGAAFMGTTTNHPLNLVSNNASVIQLTPAREIVMASSVAPQGKLTIQTDRNDQSGIVLISPDEESLQLGVTSALALLGASKPLGLFAGNGRILLNTDGRVSIGRDPSTNSALAVSVGASSVADTGVQATSGTGIGVLGESGSGRGVLGTSGTGPGVRGTSGTDIGVEGFSQAGTGVRAEVQGVNPGIAIQVITGDFMRGVSLSPPIPGQRFHITNAGTFVAGSDFAEALPARHEKETYAPGDVLVLSTAAPGGVERASVPYDVRVAGVYSTRPGVLGADKDGETRVDINDVPVALVGIVPTKVSAENGPIQVGDQLTTSATPGHAMRCADRTLCLGAVIGKAMAPLAGGTGVIKVLVTLR